MIWGVCLFWYLVCWNWNKLEDYCYVNMCKCWGMILVNLKVFLNVFVL